MRYNTAAEAPDNSDPMISPRDLINSWQTVPSRIFDRKPARTGKLIALCGSLAAVGLGGIAYITSVASRQLVTGMEGESGQSIPLISGHALAAEQGFYLVLVVAAIGMVSLLLYHSTVAVRGSLESRRLRVIDGQIQDWA
jgi:hypothetical protein